MASGADTVSAIDPVSMINILASSVRMGHEMNKSSGITLKNAVLLVIGEDLSSIHNPKDLKKYYTEYRHAAASAESPLGLLLAEIKSDDINDRVFDLVLMRSEAILKAAMAELPAAHPRAASAPSVFRVRSIPLPPPVKHRSVDDDAATAMTFSRTAAIDAAAEAHYYNQK